MKRPKQFQPTYELDPPPRQASARRRLVVGALFLLALFAVVAVVSGLAGYVDARFFP